MNRWIPMALLMTMNATALAESPACSAPGQNEQMVVDQYHASVAKSCTDRGGQANKINGQLICTHTQGSRVVYYFTQNSQCRMQAMIHTSHGGARPDPMQGYLDKLFNYANTLKTASARNS